MNRMKENELLRLSMILENQGETTRNKYICKLAESVIFDSESDYLSSVEICRQIEERFQLVFDIVEIEKAIDRKGKGRIIPIDNMYSLSPKVSKQLSSVVSFEDKLKEYIQLYIKQTSAEEDAEIILNVLQKHLYYCFNSNAKNFATIIGCNLMSNIDNSVITDYCPTAKETKIINDFLGWDNNEKNELLYQIVASCYEYCLITVNKNPVISKEIFRGKKFFLDTNIIFRLAGVNTDTNQVIVDAFVNKCKELGLKICYTNYVLDEIYRVIDKEIDYIRKEITKGQAPISAKVFGQINCSYKPNDFYVLYYDWCKNPQNKYNDFLTFRQYVLDIILGTLAEFEFSNAPDYSTHCPKRFTQLFNSLKDYKIMKRTYQRTTDESVWTDVNQVLDLENIRPRAAKNLWDMNEYLISADQYFISWAECQFAGVPIVVIPSLWLSLILKISGRASENDYKSFCTFMTLRQHHSAEDEININPITLLLNLSEKTIDARIKENVINEILSNKSAYSFNTDEDYESSINKAFDVVLSNQYAEQKEKLAHAVESERANYILLQEKYERELSQKKTEEEYAKTIANTKSTKKVEWFKEHTNIYILIKTISIVIVAISFVLIVFDIGPAKDLFLSVFKQAGSNDTWVSVVLWAVEILLGALAASIKEMWDYLGSETRKSKLYRRYYIEQMNMLKSK